MIFTITPNPCLDLSGMVTRVIPNEKSYVHHEVRSPGGNSINAARVIRRLGVPVLASGFLGGGVGMEVSSFLDQESVDHQFIQIKGNTRINVTISNPKDHRQTRLSFPGPKILPHEKKALLAQTKKIKSDSLLVIGGSLPPGFTQSHLIEIIKLAGSRNLATIVDIPGDLLKATLNAPTLMIKPNLTEFQIFARTRTQDLHQIQRLAQKLTSRIPLICISSVANGALLVTPQGSWHGRTPKLQVKSTVGAGDSMVGAMSVFLWKESLRTRQSIHSLVENSIQNFAADLLKHGLAAACGTLSHPGMILTSKEDLKHFLPRIQIERIQ